MFTLGSSSFSQPFRPQPSTQTLSDGSAYFLLETSITQRSKDKMLILMSLRRWFPLIILIHNLCLVEVELLPRVVGCELWGQCPQQEPGDAESFINSWNNLQVSAVSSTQTHQTLSSPFQTLNNQICLVLFLLGQCTQAAFTTAMSQLV